MEINIESRPINTAYSHPLVNLKLVFKKRYFITETIMYLFFQIKKAS